MPKIYRISKIGTRILQKIRHRRGHGIHSPFVFSLITNVIEEKRKYYAFDDIQNFISKYDNVKQHSKKYNRFVFRIINHFSAKNILEIGSGDGQTTLYASASSSSIRCNCYEPSTKKSEKANILYNDWGRSINLHTDSLPHINDIQDCIIVDLKNYFADYDLFLSYILPLCNEETFIIIKGIRTKRKNQMLWRMLKQSEKVTVSLDLFNIGVLFFDKRFYKRNYRLNF
ncbi:class I SAM-dependent methyltransferase [Dysgonomonas sp. 520]|uniref:class I SAM-dependent methyltransferase n=1 Tax=Dysgonomonas sp. 520 TaxID=2302931 RepID=UPI0013D42EB3|nr:class I SAM-dependent methyltransferase [Dysgonomonas sp. 520]NDW08207.1 class I SAM-dependent methyltransferase [Dysgonomonas sp. 520]